MLLLLSVQQLPRLTLPVRLEAPLRAQGYAVAQFPITDLAPPLDLLTLLGSHSQNSTHSPLAPLATVLGEASRLLKFSYFWGEWALSSQETQHPCLDKLLVPFPSAIFVQFTFSCLDNCRGTKQMSQCETCQHLFPRRPQFLPRTLLEPLLLDCSQEKKRLSSYPQMEGRENSNVLPKPRVWGNPTPCSPCSPHSHYHWVLSSFTLITSHNPSHQYNKLLF